MIDRITEIKNYCEKVENANVEATKREAFKDLLNRLFALNDETRSIVDVITSGSEKRILNIPRRDKLHRGAADQLYNRIIIEFENDLSRTLTHAKEQLAGYLLGQFRSGEGYNYTLIASDLINWKVFSIDISSLENLAKLNEDELVLNEVTSSSFQLKNGNEDDFFYWIDRFLFKEEKQKASLARIEERFGNNGVVFREAYLEMQKYFDVVKERGELQVAYDEWKKMLSIAYDSFDDSTNNFLIHTYLSVVAKMLAYEVISNDSYIDDDEIKGILDGTVFHNLNIGNFVENDFFSWIASADARRALKKVFRLIAQELSTFDFSGVDEDILKGVYQDLIDLDTRKRLGEYYTPDWLCERIVAEFDFRPGEKILDPACGSGSFLRAVVDKLRREFPDRPVEEVNAQVHGIDIHPLSVQIAKTTLLLALGRKGIRNARRPVHLNIILANTLLTPKGVGDLFGSELKMEIDNERLSLDSAIFDDAELFDIALETADELADQTAGNLSHSIEDFQKALEQGRGLCITLPLIVEDFHKIYMALKTAKENGRDSIWKFIVQNLYKPYFMTHKFDYVIGNPPWFTYRSIKSSVYQETLDRLATDYDVQPDDAKNYPNLEIAAIFQSYCSGYFLKEGGRIAFVLPRSFFSSDHHDNTRSGRAEGFFLTVVWDLEKVFPLFKVPSCVLFGNYDELSRLKSNAESRKQLKFSDYKIRGIAGKEFAGKLSVHNSNLRTSGKLLKENDCLYFYVRQGNSTAFSKKKGWNENTNPYREDFKRGAELTPRNFYFVTLDQEPPDDLSDRVISIKTDLLPEAKKPWKEHPLSGRIESRFLFFTALSNSILPFNLYRPNLVVLPLTTDVDEFGKKGFALNSVDELRSSGFLHASRWFAQAETIWHDEKTEKNDAITAIEYLDWNQKLTKQDLNARYLVIYAASAKDAIATVTDRRDLNLNFVVDTKAYAFATINVVEAHYLAAMLNATLPNEMMKDFQTRGLFGPRDVHKKILDIYWPRFDSQNEIHVKLARLSEAAHAKAAEYLAQNPPQGNLTTHRLGRLRLDIKRHLTDEMREIDTLVETLLKS